MFLFTKMGFKLADHFLSSRACAGSFSAVLLASFISAYESELRLCIVRVLLCASRHVNNESLID